MSWSLYGCPHPVVCFTNCLRQASAILPSNSSRDECASLLAAARSMRDVYSQKRGQISQELSTIQQSIKFHEMRLDHADKVLCTIEDLIGEIRTRFIERGIPTAPRPLPPRRTSAAVESGAITRPGADPITPRADGMGSEVSKCLHPGCSKPV